MLDFGEISINDKELFDKYIIQGNPQESELTFTNMFMWRKYYKFRYAVTAGFLCVVSAPEQGTPFAFAPIGSAGRDSFIEAVEEIREVFNLKGWSLEFKRVGENRLPYFEGVLNLSGNPVLDRDNSDYLYLAEELTNLTGKRFDGKRNHINRFKRKHEFEYVNIDGSNLEECFRIMDEWCAERDCEEHRGLYCEKLANFELLENYGRLGCRGALIRVDGKYEAFTVGEMLNDDTAVIHIEKANGRVHGLYTLVNQQFCANEWQNAMYINREQDLGIEGLRKAKLSYNPVKIVNKYTIKFA